MYPASPHFLLPDNPFQRVFEALGGWCVQRRPGDDVVEAVPGNEDGVAQSASRSCRYVCLLSTLYICWICVGTVSIE